MTNDWLATTPFDLYELFLFRLIVQQASFTKAAQTAGLTQSAVSRQIQTLESSLGLRLLERTTRKVKVTPAGAFLFKESARLVGNVEESLRRLREEFAGARKEVRVGVSHSVSLAYLPGFLHANLRREPDVACRVSYQKSPAILEQLEANELDLGVVSMPKRLPNLLRVTHRFDDGFTLIAPAALAAEYRALRKSAVVRTAWLARQNWLLLTENSTTGHRLRAWMARQGLRIEPVMQLDSFDLIINLVAVGMGVSFVPIRALALYGRKKAIHRIATARFVRELVVVLRRNREAPKHLAAFVDNILF